MWQAELPRRGGLPRVLLGVLVALSAFLRTRAGAAETVIPDKVRSAIEANAKDLTPVTITWLQTTRRGTIIERQDASRISWQDGKIYRSVKYLKPAGGQSETSFDGDIYYAGGGQQRLLNKTAIETERERPLFVTQYFESIGLTLPTSPGELMGREARSTIMALLANGGRIERFDDAVDIEGKRLVSISVVGENHWQSHAAGVEIGLEEKAIRSWAKSEDLVQRRLDALRQVQAMPKELVNVFYLDPMLHYAVRRWEERYPDGTLLRRWDNDDFSHIEPRHIWLPRKCVITWYWDISQGFRMSRDPIVQETMEVSAIDATPIPPDRFVLGSTRPGTVVTDNSGPGGARRTHQIVGSLGTSDARAWYRRPRSLFIVLSVVLLAGLGLFWHVKRHRIAR